MILVIDNHDSFVHNLARLVRCVGGETLIRRNDEISVAACLQLNPQGIVLSPGPGKPSQAGICVALIEAAKSIPLLGVCLGHQALAEAYGGRTAHACEPMHGRESDISHDGTGVFAGVPTTIKVGRYHSLISQLPKSSPLITQAISARGEIMAFRHINRPHHGVQFHPESLLTKYGRVMLANFVDLCQEPTK